MIKLDKIDHKILYELDKNCRQSLKQIAKKVGTSRDVVSYRISRLEKLKIIENYYALINYSKLGYILLRVYLRLQNTTLEIEKGIVDYLIKEKKVLTVYSTEGSWDIVMGYLVTNIKEMDYFWEEFQTQYKKYIHQQSLSLMYEFVHFNRKYLVEEKERDYEEKLIKECPKTELDNADKIILTNIATNARISLLELAKKTGLTSPTVSYKLKQLAKKEVILAYKALIDYNKLGYQYFKIDLFIEDLRQKKQLREFIKRHPNSVYEDRTFGGSDFEFDVELPSYKEFYKLIEELKTRFPKLIRVYNYYKAKKIYKYVYLPPIQE